MKTLNRTAKAVRPRKNIVKMMDTAMKRMGRDGYPHHAGPLFRRLEKLEGNSLRVQGLRLIFKSEAIRPTPFGGLCPKPVLFLRATPGWQ